jgi:response regulator of citrate/malate metabolism
MGAGPNTHSPDEGQRLGVVHYYCKPFSLEQLVQDLNQLAEEPSASAS